MGIDPGEVCMPGGTREEVDTAEVRMPPRASRALRDEHVHVLRMLTILDAVRGRIAAGDPPPPDDWVDIVNFLRVYVDRCHHGKEERVLFPAMMQTADEQTKALIELLLVEHAEGRRLVAALAAATSTDPVAPGDPQGERQFAGAAADEAIAGYVSLIRPHVVHEERPLFPIADKTLAPDLQGTLQGEYERIEAEVTGVGGHEAFEEIVERLMARYLPGRGAPARRRA